MTVPLPGGLALCGAVVGGATGGLMRIPPICTIWVFGSSGRGRLRRKIFFRIGVEAFYAAGAAKIVGLTFIFRRTCGPCRINVHVANGIFDERPACCLPACFV